MGDWARCGGAWLSGFPAGPHCGAPQALEASIGEWFAALRQGAAQWSSDITRLAEVDPFDLLGERAALEGLRRGGRRSCGGHAVLLQARDGEIAVSLGRPFDREMLGVWLAGDVDTFSNSPLGDERYVSEHLGPLVAHRSVEEVVDFAQTVGSAVSVLGESRDRLPARVLWNRPRRETRPDSPPRVLDLTALWAGPLATNLLRIAGAEVIRVENPRRPDGMRTGNPELFSLLEAGKGHRSVDPATPEGHRQLRDLLAESDVVIESARPRALEHLGIHAAEILDEFPRVSWVSITAHGRVGEHRHRVGFGDDAAIAGGLSGWDEGRAARCFLGDAIADPLTGICTAGLVAQLLAGDEQQLVEVAMARVAAACSRDGHEPWPPPIAEPEPPRARCAA